MPPMEADNGEHLARIIADLTVAALTRSEDIKVVLSEVEWVRLTGVLGFLILQLKEDGSDEAALALCPTIEKITCQVDDYLRRRAAREGGEQ